MSHPFPNEDDHEEPPTKRDVVVTNVTPNHSGDQCGFYGPEGKQCDSVAVYDVRHQNGTILPLCPTHYDGMTPIE